MDRTLTIDEDNLSVAWAKALFSVVDTGEISPLTVVIRGFTNGEPQEVMPIRKLLDDALGTDAKGLSCHEVSNTIFPDSLWNSQADRHQLYERYRRIMPRVLRDRRNRYGVYFQRMISYGHDAAYQGGVNQLEKILQAWHGGNRRRSAFQVAIFDPRKDNYNQPVRGFPCLQQVAFALLRHPVHLRARVWQLPGLVPAGPLYGSGDGKTAHSGVLCSKSCNSWRQDKRLPPWASS